LRVVNGARLTIACCSTSIGLTIAVCMRAALQGGRLEAKLAVGAAAKAFAAWSQSTFAGRTKPFFEAEGESL
jgi:hypothetical protein